MALHTTAEWSDHPVPAYPCLRRSAVTGNIVLFTGPTTGTVVHGGGDGGSSSLGHYSKEFSDASGPGWRPVKSVTIREEA